jgi:hypothetical protein
MKYYLTIPLVTVFLVITSPLLTKAQTDMDAIMMGKNQLCGGPVYAYSSWKNYWEGTLKRDNQNLGTVSTQAIGLMGAYGITGKINVLFNAPYIKTKASAGTLQGMQGMQDLSLFIKWRPVKKELGPGVFSLYGIGGVSFPLTNYVADYLPLSIGIHSTTATARLMLDYQINKFFATGSGTYVFRSTIDIDRTSYYTDQLHLSNEVEIPNASNFNFRTGYRSSKLIAEAIVNIWTTLGGEDITRNNMPFPSNKMDATTIGANIKYVVTKKDILSLVAGGNYVVSGRNVGQATTYYGSILYLIDFSHKTKSTTQTGKTN